MNPIQPFDTHLLYILWTGVSWLGGLGASLRVIRIRQRGGVVEATDTLPCAIGSVSIIIWLSFSGWVVAQTGQQSVPIWHWLPIHFGELWGLGRPFWVALISFLLPVSAVSAFCPPYPRDDWASCLSRLVALLVVVLALDHLLGGPAKWQIVSDWISR